MQYPLNHKPRFSIVGAVSINHGVLYYETWDDGDGKLMRLADDIANVCGLPVWVWQDSVKVYTARPSAAAMEAVYGPAKDRLVR